MERVIIELSTSQRDDTMDETEGIELPPRERKKSLTETIQALFKKYFS